MSYPLIFRHCVADGLIYVGNGSPQSAYPYTWWITQEPTYTCPTGAVYLQYTQSGTSGQSYWSDGSSQYALPDTFSVLGNGYIAKQSVYDIAYAAYLITPTTLEAAQQIMLRRLAAQNTTIQTGYIIDDTEGSGNQTFFSDSVTLQNLSTDLALYTPTEAVPLGYTIMNTSFVNIVCTLVDLGNVVKLIQTLYYECRINYDTHYANIMSLTTIADVMDYNITTGWAIVPFNSPSSAS